ncbi:MAG: hypothetical protein AB1456_01450 [Thermodesulfobacteriota bacterium]
MLRLAGSLARKQGDKKRHAQHWRANKEKQELCHLRPKSGVARCNLEVHQQRANTDKWQVRGKPIQKASPQEVQAPEAREKRKQNMTDRPKEPHGHADQEMNNGTILAEPRQDRKAPGDAEDKPHKGSDDY